MDTDVESVMQLISGSKYMNLMFSASSKATSKELERIDQLFYTYADGSSGLIE